MEPNGVVVCIPAYNEEGSIAKVIVESKKYADEVMVVDDGSTDSTATIAEALGVALIRHESNMGKGAALRTLMEEARKRNPTAVVTIDSDWQHDPRDIPAVVEPVLKGEADIVVGLRSKSGTMPRERVIGNRLLDEATSRKAGLKLEDTQSGFRAYSSRALALLDFREKGMAVESQTLIDAAHAGLKIVGVQVSTTYEGVKAKRNPVAHFSSVLDYVLSRTIVDSPLLYLGLPGLVATLLGIVAGLRVVVIFTSTHQIAIGTALVGAILIIIGVVALATSLILKLLTARIQR